MHKALSRRFHRRSAAPALALAVFALAGLAVGAAGAAFSGHFSPHVSAHGRIAREADAPLRAGLETSPVAVQSDGAPLREVAERPAPQRFGPTASLSTARLTPPPRFDAERAARPKIVLIADDMGLDRDVFETVLAMPGPLTFSFLSYGEDVQAMADAARAKGAGIMLHLPMEPIGDEDPGPRPIRAGASHADNRAALDWHLSRFHGYAGVNNHMGSRASQDPAAMRAVLAGVGARGLFYLDSVTIAGSVAGEAAAALGVDFHRRDLFLDDAPAREAVVEKLAALEAIARETGLAVGIFHPRPETLAAVGAWLTSAPARGFELATVAALQGANEYPDERPRALRVDAAAPAGPPIPPIPWGSRSAG